MARMKEVMRAEPGGGGDWSMPKCLFYFSSPPNCRSSPLILGYYMESGEPESRPNKEKYMSKSFG